MRSVLTALTIATLTAACTAPGTETNSLTPKQASAGWHVLFDGESTNGWRGFRSETFPTQGWLAQDDSLVHLAGGGGGDIITEEQFASFDLEYEWRIAPGGNSGVFFHVDEDHDYVWQTGPEMQVLDNKGHRDGGDPLTSAGANYALHAPPKDSTRPVGEWNKARLLVDGARVEHWLNDKLQCRYELWSEDWVARVAASKFKDMPDYGMRRTGHIALQDHGDEVAYRNIRIRRL